ncbi:MAG: V-type ATPase subunit [Lachnospiraceae bacterium]|nr:V-type ATPase subunit [Lachnospiraceae bacterium]
MSLLTYSGITTKVRAMESHLITDDQFREMAALEDVRSAADYLKLLPAYADFFADLDDTKLHRGFIEQLLTQSEYRDFSKLYRFANLAQRKFLDLYFMHYEITLIKQALRHVIGHRETTLDLSMFQDFFDQHSTIDLVALSQAENLNDFIAHLAGSPYHDLLNRLSDNGLTVSFDYEMQLDLFYFKTLWRLKTKELSKQDQRILDQCFGCRLDLLNLQWICRAKRFYSLSSSEIYALLIPVNYRLRTAQVKQLVEAATMDDFYTILKSTAYGTLPDAQLNETPDLKALYQQLLYRIYQNTSRKHPYSIAALDSYLYFKEVEMQRIITTIEGIRYGLGAGEIIALAAKQ